jgi:hypothetical protein
VCGLTEREIERETRRRCFHFLSRKRIVLDAVHHDQRRYVAVRHGEDEHEEEESWLVATKLVSSPQV